MQNAAAVMKRTQGEKLVSADLAFSQLLPIASCGLPSLYRCAYRLLGNKADAEDAVQDALLAAHKHFDQFRGDAQISTWLTTIVINCAKMQLRRRSRLPHFSLDSRIGEEHSFHEILLDDRPNPEDECHSSKLSAQLIKLVARLSPSLRRTFHLRFVHHLSICETARLLGVPIGTVKAQTARARMKLRIWMRGALPPRSCSCAARHRQQKLDSSS
jgi:RNA polymerase sigma-70 factor, ECF subfamily